MANKSKPIPLRLVTGGNRKRPHRHGKKDEQVEIKSKQPTPPKRPNGRHVLTTVGRDEWTRVCELLEAARVLTEADRTILTQYCLLYQAMIDEPEFFLHGHQTQLRLCQVEMGLTPSSRAKLRIES